MLDKYPKLELIAITYGYDKVEEVTEKTLKMMINSTLKESISMATVDW